jgi:hypothetical protein
MISVYFDDEQQMWAIDVDNKIYTFAFSEKAAQKIVNKLRFS